MKKFLMLAAIITIAGTAYAMGDKPNKQATPLAAAATTPTPAAAAPAAAMPQQQPQATPATPPTPEARAAALKIGENDVVIGKAEAPVTIIEYASLSCPHCAAFHATTLPQLQSKYIDSGKAKFVFRNFALNPPAFAGAKLVSCIGKDQYYTFTKVLFDQQSQWAFHSEFMTVLEKIAKLGGVSSKQFNDCMADKAVEERVLLIKKTGIESLEVKSTPTFFVNGQMLMGARNIDEFSAIIDPLLKGK